MKCKENIRIAFVGTGNIAVQHMKYLSMFSDVEISGLYDINEDILRTRRYEFGGETYNSIDKMLDTLEPDAVFICVPPYAHGEAELACIERSVPFFVEKPLSNDLTLAKNIAHTVGCSDIITAVGYMNRYRHGVQKARNLLKSHPVTLIHGAWLIGTPINHLWLTQKKLSGGQLIEQTTHLFDLIRYLCGEVSSIHCYGAKGFIQLTSTYDTEDASGVLIQLESGAVASVISSWSSGLEHSIYLRLFGPDIYIEFDDWEFDTKIIMRERSYPLEIPGEKNIFAIEDRAFIDAVKYNDPSGILSDYEDGVRSLELSFAANESLETGKPVHITQFR